MKSHKQQWKSTSRIGQDLYYQALRMSLGRNPTLKEYLEMCEMDSGQELAPEVIEEIREMYYEAKGYRT